MANENAVITALFLSKDFINIVSLCCVSVYIGVIVCLAFSLNAKKYFYYLLWGKEKSAPATAKRKVKKINFGEEEQLMCCMPSAIAVVHCFSFKWTAHPRHKLGTPSLVISAPRNDIDCLTLAIITLFALFTRCPRPAARASCPERFRSVCLLPRMTYTISKGIKQIFLLLVLRLGQFLHSTFSKERGRVYLGARALLPAKLFYERRLTSHRATLFVNQHYVLVILTNVCGPHSGTEILYVYSVCSRRRKKWNVRFNSFLSPSITAEKCFRPFFTLSSERRLRALI